MIDNSTKSFSNSPINLLTGKIHQAYTVAADELLLRGYITQPIRLEIGGKIGELLQAMQKDLLAAHPELEDSSVDPECVDAIAEKMAPAPAPASNWLGWLQHGVNIAAKALGLPAGKPLPAPNFSMSIIKQADGSYRWTTFSSSAFRDRDGQIVSTDALEADVAWADSTKEFGPLKWWHTPIILGAADFNAMAGRILIESGTFTDPALGAAFKEAADGLTVSIGFKHPPDEPDAGGVFSHIRRFERSLLPAGRESNLFTQLVVKEHETMAIDKQKLKALEDLVGPEMAQSLLAQAQTAEKAADLAGVAYKAGAPFPGAKPPFKPEGEPDGDEAEPEMGPDGKPVKKAKPKPAVDEEKVKELVAEMTQPLLVELGSIKQMVAGLTAAQTTTKAQLTPEQQEWVSKVKALQAQMDELLGSQPRRSKGYRPTQDADTIVEEKAAAGPVANQDFAGFLGFAVTGQTPPNGKH